MNVEINKVVCCNLKQKNYDRTKRECTMFRSFAANEINKIEVEKFYKFMKKKTTNKVPKLSFEVSLDFLMFWDMKYNFCWLNMIL